jgi:tRNA/rRNA methyltransferase
MPAAQGGAKNKMSQSPPIIILVRPQLGQNIGKAARAMLNFGLTELRLVAPRDGWPNPDAGPSASGADVVLDQARVFDSLEVAVADLNHVFATTVRSRDMSKSAVPPEQAAVAARAAAFRGEKTGFLFGPERSGLANEDLLLADTILTIPVNAVFGSLNLAQAVVLVAYEWSKAEGLAVPDGFDDRMTPANKEELFGLFGQIERDLDASGYFHPAERRGAMIKTLRNLLQSAKFSSQQIQTLRGMLKSLAGSGK